MSIYGYYVFYVCFFFFSSRRRHTRLQGDWSSDVCSSDLGLASLVLWLIAMVVFFLPSAVAVRELADIDPGAGGIYRWVRRAFGPLHGFVAGWGYWVNNLFYFPSLLVATAAIAAYAGGPRFVRLGDDNLFIGALSLAGAWLRGGMNLGGLRIR